ncbi:MAG: hypothetical protein WC371_00120 [Parachlamydiales bacterium]|jgi:hypothetical protein
MVGLSSVISHVFPPKYPDVLTISPEQVDSEMINQLEKNVWALIGENNPVDSQNKLCRLKEQALKLLKKKVSDEAIKKLKDVYFKLELMEKCQKINLPFKFIADDRYFRLLFEERCIPCKIKDEEYTRFQRSNFERMVYFNHKIALNKDGEPLFKVFNNEKSQLCTINELCDYNFIQIVDGLWLPNADIVYLENGFVQKSSQTWEKLFEFKTLPEGSRPNFYQLDIVSTFPSRKNIDFKKGHTFIRLIKPTGEVYSVGVDLQKYDIETHTQKLLLTCPDQKEFAPKTKFGLVTASYKLEEDAFNYIVEFIEKEQSEILARNEDAFLYQNLTKNCATFAENIRKIAIEKGAQKIPSNKSSDSEIPLFLFQRFVLKLELALLSSFVNMLIFITRKFTWLRNLNFQNAMIQMVYVEIISEKTGSLARNLREKKLKIFLPAHVALNNI